MSSTIPKYNRTAGRLLTACLGSVFVLVSGTVGASAQSSKPTLSELLESIPVRPTVAQPAIEAPEELSPAVQDVDAQAIRLRLSLSDKRVYVYRGGSVEVSYPVAVGRPGWETPTGEFEIFHQLENPGWTNPLTDEVMLPGPDNPLGERWMAFWTDGTNVIGFHGTPNRSSVGTAASHGCIRMYNEDVKELYEIVAMGTPVIVEP